MGKLKTILLILFPILIFLTLIFVTVRPFTISCTIRVRIEKGDNNILATYENEKIQKFNEDKNYYILIPNAPILKGHKVEAGAVKLKCTKAQLQSIDNLQEHYYNLLFETNKFDLKNGKLISIYE
ncbi:hypothetical protein HMPREF1982_00853 [Clostridiales bacterium oral taxon 876 str. F0540]|nr:hypothetical protein HMPREF1982_00853 [Clostridiales bacterium oral taxon 876 str. F0540]